MFLVQFCFSQEGQNVIHLTFFRRSLKKFTLKKSLSDESEITTFYENVFNGARRLICQTLWLLFLFQYERVNKLCMTNAQARYYELFSSCFSESWYLFSQNWLDLEELIVDVISALLPFCVKEFVDFVFQVSIRISEFIGGQM